ncbi:MAG: hypothetical protein WCZ90_08285 [Melioribacteraceae bacterium]
MPSEESKTFLELKGKLENLSDGVKKHAADESFPSNISAASIDASIASFTQKRKAFDDAENLAHQKSEEYSSAYDECDRLFSQLCSQIYGFYGKQNLVVEDFGLKTYQKPVGRKAKVTAASQQQ